MLRLIVNPSAGGGRAGQTLATARAELQRRGGEHRVQETQSLAHAQELAGAAAAQGDVAVAIGGDGLVGAVAAGLAGTGGVLGVVPGGRGNDFVRMLGIPRDPVAACAVLDGGTIREIDVGAVVGSGSPPARFISIASCGLDSSVNAIANETRVVRGGLVYLYAMLRGILGWRPVQFTVAVDGGPERTFRGYTVAAANTGAYGGGMRLAPDASPTDGAFDIVLIAGVSRLRFLILCPLVFTGRHVRSPKVEVIRGRSIAIAADRPLTVYADGDPLTELPATLTVEPRAIRVLVPAEART